MHIPNNSLGVDEVRHPPREPQEPECPVHPGYPFLGVGKEVEVQAVVEVSVDLAEEVLVAGDLGGVGKFNLAISQFDNLTMSNCSYL